MRLRQEGANNYYVSNGRGFNGTALSREDVQRVIDFAYDMCFGAGHHRVHRTGGQYGRRAGEKFCNTFQGKLGEVALYNFFTSNNIVCNQPDFRIMGEGVWDDSDLEIYGKKINVKSVASQSNLLLLETDDWNAQGQYIPNLLLNNGSTVQYDYFILVRLDPDIKRVFRAEKLMYSDAIEKAVIERLIFSKAWSYDIAGYTTTEYIIATIANGYILPQNSILNLYTTMDARNYYVQSGDLGIIDNLLTQLRAIPQ